MARHGWQRLVAGAHRLGREGGFALPAYSEFMPPPRFGPLPCGGEEPSACDPLDPFGWRVDEYEQAWELGPGLAHIAGHFQKAMVRLAEGKASHGVAPKHLEGNPCWPPELAARAGSLRHERFVAILPLALSRTQDDKGRVRWTLFGSSEQGPEQALWKGCLSDPRTELPAERGLAFVRQILQQAYGESPRRVEDLRACGFRILPSTRDPARPHWRPERLPSWTRSLSLRRGESLRRVRYLLTFRPFGQLPLALRRAYLGGRLHLLPFPGSLLFWNAPAALALARELPLAAQIPLLALFERCEAPRGIRIPQSGWLHEPSGEEPRPRARHGPIRNRYRRTHRWERVHRHEDELAVSAQEDRLAHVLFSSAPEDVGLYGKPMARNAQLWSADYRLLLDGRRAGRAELERAAAALRRGGHFGYRFLFPAMRVGRHELYWQRPLVAFRDPASGRPVVAADAPAGYLTAYRWDRVDPARALELWPRLLARPLHRAAAALAGAEPGAEGHRTAQNLRKLLETWELGGRLPLDREFARSLVTAAKATTLEAWLARLEELGGRPVGGMLLAGELRERIRQGPAPVPEAADALTFRWTARRRFETAYWRTIRRLAHGRFVNKENADCVRDAPTRARLRHRGRDLDALGDFLLGHYRRLLRARRMSGRALAGELPFRWTTDFDYAWSEGWARSREREAAERNLVVVIPGRNRREAVLLADHYDTAYMEDVYEKARGGSGARLAAAGADDNHSATAALMLAAPIFLELSRAGRLGCDVWLVHLTGEEFPSDCLGARHLAQQLALRRARLRVPGGWASLARARIRGAYVMDMIAHNNDRDRDVFQISPGRGRRALWLARQAQQANLAWNRGVPLWNGRPGRRGRGRGVRVRDPRGRRPPATAAHLALHGEIRVPHDSHSSLFNTDGQIFSDVGIPVVLLMENYDIQRVGYHDTRDTMANIDLDFGAAVAAIAIEAVARAAEPERAPRA